MSYARQIIRKHWKINSKVILQDYRLSRDKEYFKPIGTQIYVGTQGQGKTISLVHDLTKIRRMYPRALVVSNLLFSDMKPLKFQTVDQLHKQTSILKRLTPDQNGYMSKHGYILIRDINQLITALTNVNNSTYGVIYAIDEIHSYYNSLDSKNIPPEIFAEISQQRKQRKAILGTSQLFTRLAKPFREQADSIILCSTYLGKFTTQTAIDGESLTYDADGTANYNTIKKGFFMQTVKLREKFDTYQKITSRMNANEIGNNGI